MGTREVRFAFCKKTETLEAAVANLKAWSDGKRKAGAATQSS